MFTIHSFEDFCLWMYVMIDDWFQQQTELPRRPGPAPTTCSDSELLTMVLVGECRGWTLETDLLDRWREHPRLFPQLPSLSRLNRRRRQLVGALQALQAFLLKHWPWTHDPLLVLDSVPIAVVSRAHAAHASSDWRIHGAGYGYSHTKRWPFFGYYLQVLMTYGGVVLDWALMSPSIGDVAGGEDLLQHTPVPLAGRLVLGDKGYTSAPMQARVWATRAVRLLVLPKRGMKTARSLPLAVRRRFARVRQRIETLNSQIVVQFDIQRTTAHSFWGLVTRLRSKLLAHVCCVYANWQTGVPLEDALHIKHLVATASSN